MAQNRPTAYVPGYEHDIFISYASVDDAPELGIQGWVSTFVELLTKRLARLLGRPDCFSLWMDRTRLNGTTLLTSGLEKSLKKTAVMVALLSNGYLASPWCPWEREVFLQAVGPWAEDCTQLFVVELDRLEPEQRPREFVDHRAYTFWTQEPLAAYPRLLGASGTASDPDYLSRLDALARDLVEVLKRMKERARHAEMAGENGKAKAPPIEPLLAKRQTNVYLAEVTDDLDSLWWKVKGYLEQQQIGVVPRQDLPRDRDAFRQAVVSNLHDADLFVQLLAK